MVARAALVFACALLLALRWRCHPALIILGAGIAGVIAGAV